MSRPLRYLPLFALLGCDPPRAVLPVPVSSRPAAPSPPAPAPSQGLARPRQPGLAPGPKPLGAPPALGPERPAPEPEPPRAIVQTNNDADALPQGMPRPFASDLEFVVTHTQGASPAESLPMLVLLHGYGDSPTAFIRPFQSLELHARVIALRAPEEAEGGFAWFPIATDGRESETFVRNLRSAEQRVAGMLETLPTRFNTCGRPVLSGFSQGAMLSFAVAALHPERIAAAAPFAGMLPRALWPTRPPSPMVPLEAFHGSVDGRIPFADGRAAVEALSRAGYTAQLATIPGGDHTIDASSLTALKSTLARLLRVACPTAR